MNSGLDKLLETFKIIAEGKSVARPEGKFSTYAISNFRGGIGKSTLAFNLAWEVSRQRKSLLFDLCPQTNFTQSLIGADAEESQNTIYDALLPRVMRLGSQVDLILIPVIAEEQHLAAVGDQDQRIVGKGHGVTFSFSLSEENAAPS